MTKDKMVATNKNELPISYKFFSELIERLNEGVFKNLKKGKSPFSDPDKFEMPDPEFPFLKNSLIHEGSVLYHLYDGENGSFKMPDFNNRDMKSFKKSTKLIALFTEDFFNAVHALDLDDDGKNFRYVYKRAHRRALVQHQIRLLNGKYHKSITREEDIRAIETLVADEVYIADVVLRAIQSVIDLKMIGNREYVIKLNDTNQYFQRVDLTGTVLTSNLDEAYVFNNYNQYGEQLRTLVMHSLLGKGVASMHMLSSLK